MFVIALSLGGSLIAGQLSANRQLLDPLTLVLAGCGVLANVLALRFEGRFVIDGSFIPVVLAAAFLGPAPTILVAVVSELGAWPILRSRPIAVAINIAGTTAPGVVAAFTFAALAGQASTSSPLFAATLAFTTALYIAGNCIIVVGLTRLVDDNEFRAGFPGVRLFLPAIGLTVTLAVAAARVYDDLGPGASVFIAVIVLAFSYTIHLVARANRRTLEAAEEASRRGALVAHGLQAEERERRRLADALHDGPLQNLLTARQELSRGESEEIDRARSAIEETITQLRDAALNLHPAVLEHRGLESALEAVASLAARRGGFTCQVEVGDIPEVHDAVVVSLVRELLANVVKHANAREVSVRAVPALTGIELSVIDDGKGFDGNALSSAVEEGHIGLAACSERARALGGSLRVIHTRGGGTTVSVLLPC
jgi:signal transduction histidine kinase